MPRTQAYLLWLKANGDNPTPPATAAALPKPQNVVDLGEAFKRVYSDRPRRIA